jgi:hypothetical protein
MVAFCCGVSCASFLYRSTAGIFAKVLASLQKVPFLTALSTAG